MDIGSAVTKAERRVKTAREIADHFRGNDRLHRLTMQTVFVLEDVVFALRQLAPSESDKHGPDPHS